MKASDFSFVKTSYKANTREAKQYFWQLRYSLDTLMKQLAFVFLLAATSVNLFAQTKRVVAD